MHKNIQTGAYKQRAIFIAGLTASGKSQLALNIAAKINAAQFDNQKAVIVNADSMQVYQGLRILTARPSQPDLMKAQHKLYGFVDPIHAFSTGAWLKAVEELLASSEMQDKFFIFVGGTGLYYRALLGGLAEIPAIDNKIKQEAEDKEAQDGLNVLYSELIAHDPITANRLACQDRQRILRAWQVWRQTGQPLSFWQTQKKPALLEASKVKKIAIIPERETIYQRINQRVDAMLAEGVLQEIAAFKDRQLDSQLPAMKAAGLREFMAYLDHKIDLTTAIEKAQQETRRYAKRQRTWFNNQLTDDWQKLASIEDFSVTMM